MKRRYMLNPEKERQVFGAVLMFTALALIVIIVTSCSPYAVGTNVPNSPTPSPSATGTPGSQNSDYPPLYEIDYTPRPSCTVTGSVYLRPDPSRLHAPLAVLRAGQILEVVTRGDWLKVTTGNQAGYIYGRYCR